jgi:hypothetical protein
VNNGKIEAARNAVRSAVQGAAKAGAFSLARLRQLIGRSTGRASADSAAGVVAPSDEAVVSTDRVARRKASQREAARRWRAAHPDRAREQSRRWRAAHPDKARECSRRWRAANADKTQQYERVRRQRCAGIIVDPAHDTREDAT